MSARVNKAAFLFILGTVYFSASDNVVLQAATIDRQVPFGGTEIHSTYIAPFSKWTGVLARMDKHTAPLKPLQDNARMLSKLSLVGTAQKVNDIVNGYSYVADITLWGISDYWATPAEFFAKGGDCEDFAIAKYAWLSSIGVPEDQLRIAIVHDRIRNIAHAVLILYIENKAMILDNQVRDIRDSNLSSRYKMLYSINRKSWWLPRPPRGPALSSALNVDEAGYMHSQIEPASNGDTRHLFKNCHGDPLLSECINSIEPTARR